MNIPKEKQCPKCGSETLISLDDHSWFELCLECGYMIRFEGLKYENGVEALVMSTNYGTVAMPIGFGNTRIKNFISDRIKEARILILAQLANGALTKRMLMIKLRRENVFRPAFEYAIRQLREKGIIQILKPANKGSHIKFTL